MEARMKRVGLFRVKRGLESDLRAIVPPHWILEMANGLSTAERTGKLTDDDSADGLRQLEMLTNSVIQVDTEASSLREAFTGSRAFRVTAYEAVYLDLARRFGLPIAT